ncbi:MAG: hypothetical protein ACRDN0_16145 [Trebonia sp.]
MAVVASRLASRAVSWCAGITRRLSHGLVLAAVARAAGPGATVIERRADGAVLAITLAGRNAR